MLARRGTQRAPASPDGAAVASTPIRICTRAARIRQLGAPERAAIGRAGKARGAATAPAIARVRNAASAFEDGRVGCAASSPER